MGKWGLNKPPIFAFPAVSSFTLSGWGWLMCIYVPEDISWKSSTERTFLQSSEGEVSSMCALFFFTSRRFFLLAQLGGWWRWFSVETYLVNVTFYFLRCWLVEM